MKKQAKKDLIMKPLSVTSNPAQPEPLDNTSHSVQALLSSISHDIRERIRSIRGRLSTILDEKKFTEKIGVDLTKKADGQIREVGEIIADFRGRPQVVNFETITDFIQNELNPKLAAYNETLTQLNTIGRSSRAVKEIEAIQTHSRRMARIVQGIDSFAKSSGKLLRTHFGVHNEIEKVKNDLERTIADNNAVIIHNGLAKIYGDQLKIAQLLQNLIQNAIIYSKDDVAPEIAIDIRNIRGGDLPEELKKHLPDAQTKEGYVYIRVTDNGIGIADEHQKKVFDLHYRINPEKKPDDVKRSEEVRKREDNRGGGLGLAIVKSIAEAHEGAAWLESRVDIGTIVHILLLNKNNT